MGSERVEVQLIIYISLTNIIDTRKKAKKSTFVHLLRKHGEDIVDLF
jgi:hypothetical protein